jgi:hypothetical protein
MVTTQMTAEPAVPQLVGRNDFAAPRDLLFRAYTDPELLVQWLEPQDRDQVLRYDMAEDIHESVERLEQLLAQLVPGESTVDAVGAYGRAITPGRSHRQLAGACDKSPVAGRPLKTESRIVSKPGYVIG